MTEGGPPAWTPAAVGAAARRRTEDDPADGLELLIAGMYHAAATIEDTGVTGVDRAAGYRHLMVLLALGIDEALRPPSGDISTGNVSSFLSWGMDCPDALYAGTRIDEAGRYRVFGTRGSVRYLGFQLMGGMTNLGNIVADELDIAEDGSFEFELGGRDRPLAPGVASMVIRQFFYDWENERPAELHIQRLDRADDPRPPATEPSAVARQLAALGTFLEESVTFWRNLEEMGRGQGLNMFRTPDARTDMGGAAENVSVWGSWDLGPDQGLLIEVEPVPATYWSVSLGNYWWETIDWANRQTSLNGHQAVLDDGGVFRAVVSSTDPGVANWLDAASHTKGAMIFRWLRADGAIPAAATSVITLDRIPDNVPRIDHHGRATALAARRAGAARRRTGR